MAEGSHLFQVVGLPRHRRGVRHRVAQRNNCGPKWIVAIVTRRLDNTVALVTGASSGIGEATAIALAAEGATVALLARRKDRLDDLTARIEAAGGTALAVEADVSDQSRAAAAVERVVDRLGRLDTLVNNAGLMLIGPAADADPADWDTMLSVNVAGVLYMTRAALPHLIAAAADSPRGVADVVNISSTAGRVARPGTAVYSLTKFGVGAFSEAVRQEVLGQRVRVGLVEPGTVQTEITDNLSVADREAIEQRSPGMVKLEPGDIADAVTYMVTRDRRVAVNEILVRAAEQTW
ncbi:SDR family NAD(P)-dependent oxidoreductase [Mycobacterium hodleri]|nr:SDR family NAD(P)-dependent oxidoreductase [Mycolicibacterium hodleri]